MRFYSGIQACDALQRIIDALPDHTDDATLTDVQHATWCLRIACDGECCEYGGES